MSKTQFVQIQQIPTSIAAPGAVGSPGQASTVDPTIMPDVPSPKEHAATKIATITDTHHAPGNSLLITDPARAATKTIEGTSRVNATGTSMLAGITLLYPPSTSHGELFHVTNSVVTSDTAWTLLVVSTILVSLAFYAGFWAFVSSIDK